MTIDDETPETKEEKDDDDGSNNNTQDMKRPSSEEEPKLDSNEQGEKEDFVNQGKILLVLVANCTVVLCAVVCCCSHTHSLSCVGLRRWEALRKGWLSQKSDESTPKAAIPLDVDEIIDLIFSQRWRSQEGDRSQFPQAVPLPQMVDILVDLWEAEGLDI